MPFGKNKSNLTDKCQVKLGNEELGTRKCLPLRTHDNRIANLQAKLLRGGAAVDGQFEEAA